MVVGTPEILVVFLIVLLLFGPKKLPELARGVGKAINAYKKELHGDSKERKG